MLARSTWASTSHAAGSPASASPAATSAWWVAEPRRYGCRTSVRSVLGDPPPAPAAAAVRTNGLFGSTAAGATWSSIFLAVGLARQAGRTAGSSAAGCRLTFPYTVRRTEFFASRSSDGPPPAGSAGRSPGASRRALSTSSRFRRRAVRQRLSASRRTNSADRVGSPGGRLPACSSRTGHFRDQPFATNRAARSSRSSGCEGGRRARQLLGVVTSMTEHQPQARSRTPGPSARGRRSRSRRPARACPLRRGTARARRPTLPRTAAAPPPARPSSGCRGRTPAGRVAGRNVSGPRARRRRASPTSASRTAGAVRPAYSSWLLPAPSTPPPRRRTSSRRGRTGPGRGPPSPPSPGGRACTPPASPRRAASRGADISSVGVGVGGDGRSAS